MPPKPKENKPKEISGEKATPTDLKSRFKIYQKGVEVFEPRRYRNISAFLDDSGHWADWNSEHGKVKLMPNKLLPNIEGKNEVKPVLYTDNLIRKGVLGVVGITTGGRPRWEVLPVGTQDSDVNAAQKADRYCNGFWKHLNIQAKYKAARLMADLAGNHYLWPYWNSAVGDIIDRDPTTTEPNNYPIEGETGEQKLYRMTSPDGIPIGLLREGDVDIKSLTFDMVFPESGYDKLEDAPSFFVREVVRIKDLLVHPQFEDDKRREEILKKIIKVAAYSPSDLQQKCGAVLGASFDAGGPEKQEKSELADPDSTYLFTYFEKPSMDREGGLELQYVELNDGILVLSSKPLPENGKFGYPVIEFWHTKIPGIYCGLTSVELALSPNFQINQILTDMNEIREKAGPFITIDMSQPKSEELKTNLERSGFRVIPYNGLNTGGQIPAHVEPGQNPPDSWFKLLQHYYLRVEDQFGRHDLKFPRQPANQTARAIAWMIQQDTGFLQSLVVDDSEAQLSKVMFWIIKLAQKGYTLKRSLIYMGDARKYEMVEFAGSELSDWDIRIAPGTTMLPSRAVIKEDLFQMVELGLFNKDEKGRNEVARILEWTQMLPMTEDALNEANATNENYEMIRTMKVAYVGPVDDHIIHSNNHARYLLSADVVNQELEKRKKIEAVILAHSAIHVAAIEQTATTMAAAPQQPQPAPAEAGPPKNTTTKKPGPGQEPPNKSPLNQPVSEFPLPGGV